MDLPFDALLSTLAAKHKAQTATCESQQKTIDKLTTENANLLAKIKDLTMRLVAASFQVALLKRTINASSTASSSSEAAQLLNRIVNVDTLALLNRAISVNGGRQNGEVQLIDRLFESDSGSSSEEPQTSSKRPRIAEPNTVADLFADRVQLGIPSDSFNCHIQDCGALLGSKASLSTHFHLFHVKAKVTFQGRSEVTVIHRDAHGVLNCPCGKAAFKKADWLRNHAATCPGIPKASLTPPTPVPSAALSLQLPHFHQLFSSRDNSDSSENLNESSQLPVHSNPNGNTHPNGVLYEEFVSDWWCYKLLTNDFFYFRILGDMAHTYRLSPIHVRNSLRQRVLSFLQETVGAHVHEYKVALNGSSEASYLIPTHLIQEFMKWIAPDLQLHFPNGRVTC
ncbi:hypothetical protein HDU78_003709 [Chytriomyces hyalinus]|nr:hypothetical protein HDU78_003709 [Chytriomyces hyalinus]